MDHDPSRSGREGTLCRSQTGFGGPLSASVGYFRQSARGAVSPRSLQPVPLESVLGPRSLWQDRIGIEPSQWMASGDQLSRPAVEFVPSEDHMSDYPVH